MHYIGFTYTQSIGKEAKSPVVCMGCAHPAKFASTIAEALRLSESEVGVALLSMYD